MTGRDIGQIQRFLSEQRSALHLGRLISTYYPLVASTEVLICLVTVFNVDIGILMLDSEISSLTTPMING